MSSPGLPKASVSSSEAACAHKQSIWEGSRPGCPWLPAGCAHEMLGACLPCSAAVPAACRYLGSSGGGTEEARVSGCGSPSPSHPSPRAGGKGQKGPSSEAFRPYNPQSEDPAERGPVTPVWHLRPALEGLLASEPPRVSLGGGAGWLAALFLGKRRSSSSCLPLPDSAGRLAARLSRG